MQVMSLFIHVLFLLDCFLSQKENLCWIFSVNKEFTAVKLWGNKNTKAKVHRAMQYILKSCDRFGWDIQTEYESLHAWVTLYN